MNPGRIVDIMIPIGTKNVSRSSDAEDAHWESMLVCLFATVWQRFQCAVLTVWAIPMSTKTLSSTGRRRMKESLETTSCEIWKVAMLDH